MLKWLEEKWAINDPLPSEVDLIAVISYASTSRDLTVGSRMVTMLAKNVAYLYPEASVAWGWFLKNPDRLIEKEIKSSILSGICVGPVSSSTDECEAIRKVAIETGKSINIIVVIAEGAHSRRCKRVWEFMFPNAKVRFLSVPTWAAADKENPMWFQRNWRVWLLVNIMADLLAYRWKFVLRFLIRKNFSQPAS